MSSVISLKKVVTPDTVPLFFLSRTTVVVFIIPTTLAPAAIPAPSTLWLVVIPALLDTTMLNSDPIPVEVGSDLNPNRSTYFLPTVPVDCALDIVVAVPTVTACSTPFKEIGMLFDLTR